MNSEQVYDLLKKVPSGRITTYKELAKAFDTKAYRAVGQILKRNPYSPEVPCHRVVSSSGTIGGFSGDTTGKNIQKKINMLKKEGIRIEGKKIKNFEQVIFRFP